MVRTSKTAQQQAFFGQGQGVVACSVGSVVLSDMVAVSSAMASSL